MVTVAIPVLNGGELFVSVLQAVRAQALDAAVEVLVSDSGSTDGSVERAREYGARVIEIERSSFNHGATRNLLIGEARGSHVALLTQDAIPAHDSWLALMLSGFQQAADVGLVYGPYLARPNAPAFVRSELDRWFGSLPAGVERLAPDERDLAAVELMGRRGFFTDANACISRVAWQRVPFRAISYAEDRALALDMLRAGYAKVYEPRAAVVHSHEYRARDRFRRAFDESRGLHDVYGWREPVTPRHVVSQLRGEIGGLHRDGIRARTIITAAWNRLMTYAGAVLGTRSEHLPRLLQRRCSLEGRET